MYAELLKDEMERSLDFSSTNFGQIIGPEFSAMVRELLGDAWMADRAAVARLYSAMLCGIDALHNVSSGVEQQTCIEWIELITRHLSTFEAALLMFYWGTRVERRQIEKKEVKK